MKLRTYFKAIATLVSINKVMAQLTDVISPSAVVTGSITPQSSSYSGPMAVDKDGVTRFIGHWSTILQDYSLQIDLGAS